MSETEKNFEAIFKFKKETDNTIQFKEVVDDMPPAIGTLYVKKWQWNRMGQPDQIKCIVKVD